MLQVSWRGRMTHRYSRDGRETCVWRSCMNDTFAGVLKTDAWIECMFNFVFFIFLIHDYSWCSLLKGSFLNCQLTMGWGLHPSTRARQILFLTSTLQKKATAYPSIGQKKLNGAASRMMIHFGRVMSEEIAENHPSDVHRQLWNVKLKMVRVCTHDYWCCCWLVFRNLGNYHLQFDLRNLIWGNHANPQNST